MSRTRSFAQKTIPDTKASLASIDQGYVVDLGFCLARLMHLLALPDELFLMEIFPYLHSTDLMRAFGTLGNVRLLSLTYAYIRQLDLPDEINCIHALQYYQWTQIRSLQIHEDHLRGAVFSIFPMLDHVDVRMTSSTTQSISSCLFSLCTRVKTLRLLFTASEQPPIDNHCARYIWHRESRIEHLSMGNCILMDESYFLTAASSLVCNQYLTHLSLVVADLKSSIPLLSLSPALEHLRIRLSKDSRAWSSRTRHSLKRQQWSSRVKSLHLTADGSYLDTRCLCKYIDLFSASLERLAFYAHLIQRYLMRNRGMFERYLLNHLPKLKRLDFCVHSGLGMLEVDRRRTFDRWKHQRHVISIFNSGSGFHTRFTVPFVFDCLERVTNDFVDFHSNQARPDFVLTLPSITSISFYAGKPLSLKLMIAIKRACPQLRRVDFDRFCRFHDDLIQDTQLTLPTVKLALTSGLILHFDCEINREKDRIRVVSGRLCRSVFWYLIPCSQSRRRSLQSHALHRVKKNTATEVDHVGCGLLFVLVQSTSTMDLVASRPTSVLARIGSEEIN